MNKPWVRLLMLAALALLPAAATFSGQAPATGIVSSMHDITYLGNTYHIFNPDQSDRICIFCHVSEYKSPSAGYPDYPNWNHPLSVELPPRSWAAPANFRIPFHSDPLYGQSRLCLSCHDGVTAVDTHYGDGTANNGTHVMASPGRTITDLTVTHPIGFSYADAFAARGSSVLQDVIGDGTTYVADVTSTVVRGARKISDQLYDGTYMTCATCHVIHNDNNAVNPPSVSDSGYSPNYFVWAKENKSALCISCHKMAFNNHSGATSPAPAGSGILNTSHDITYLASQGGFYQQEDFGRVCIFCHSPHNAQPWGAVPTPLNNHEVSPVFLSPYVWRDPANSSILFNADPLVGPSRTCLGCHNGLTAVDKHGPSIGTSQGTVAYQLLPGHVMNNPGRVITDLTVSHPVGFLLSEALAKGGANLKPGFSAFSTSTYRGNANTSVTIGSRLYGGYMTCATCHDVHNTLNATSAGVKHNYLLGGPTYQDLCLTCHVTVNTAYAHGQEFAHPPLAPSFSPTAVDFGSVATGAASSVGTVTLTNSGGDTMTITNLFLSGPDAGMFARAAAGGTCGNSLAPGGSCTFNVVFTPTTAGIRNATMAVNSVIPPGPARSVTLTGTGIDPVKLQGTPPAYFTTLGDAYLHASTGGIIQAQATTFTGDLQCNRDVSLKLLGGYDITFSSDGGFTSMTGALKVSNGTVAISRILFN